MTAADDSADRADLVIRPATKGDIGAIVLALIALLQTKGHVASNGQLACQTRPAAVAGDRTRGADRSVRQMTERMERH